MVQIVIWYIFTDDSHTNEVISRELPPENAYSEVMCFDGIERPLWFCNGTFITKMLKNKRSQNLDFSVFKKNGKYGSVKKAEFFKKKTTEKSVNKLVKVYTNDNWGAYKIWCHRYWEENASEYYGDAKLNIEILIGVGAQKDVLCCAYSTGCTQQESIDCA